MPDYPHHESVRLQSFTVFKDAAFEFVPGVNVLVGENGTGKTHLMKVLYAAERFPALGPPIVASGLIFPLFQVRNASELIRAGGADRAEVAIVKGGKECGFTIHAATPAGELRFPGGQATPRPVFVPAIDMMPTRRVSWRQPARCVSISTSRV
jgi:hypothetical protein